MRTTFLKSSAAVLAAFAIAGTAYAGSVSLNGSTTVLPVMQQVSEAFMQQHKDITVTISGTGSGNGIKALRDNMTQSARSKPRHSCRG